MRIDLLFSLALFAPPAADPAPPDATADAAPAPDADAAEADAPDEEEGDEEAGAEDGATADDGFGEGEPAEASPEEGPEEEPEFDMASVFGDPEELELEELPADGGGAAAADAPSGLAASLPGDLRFEFGALTSFYVDLDDLYGEGIDAKRWTKGYGKQRGGLGRNENRLEFYVSYTPVPKIQLVGGIEPVFMGASGVSTLGDLSSRQLIKPFHVESDKAYLAFLDIAPGLDIKIGRQIVQWGVADKFNPTNNINPDDLEDRPLFTEPIANQMVVVDYSAFEDRLQLQGVWVPIFYPALLPPSASAALQDPRSPVYFARQQDLDDLAYVQDWLETRDAFVPQVFSTVQTPTPHLRNSQAAFKVASTLGDVDLSLSYYSGFHDIPLPTQATSETTLPEGVQIGQLPEDERIKGCCFRSDVTLIYPKMHVVGADFATQIPWLNDMGLWVEAGMFIPKEEYRMRIEMPIGLQLPSLMGETGDEVEGPTVLKRPFMKLTAGGDYTVGKHVLLLGQYIHGFIDEFGLGNMGDYALVGTQASFFGRHVIAQMFAVIDFPQIGEKVDQGSLVLAPELALTPPAGYITFKLGGFAMIGDQKSKFGQRATGSSIAYVKVQGRF